MSNLADKRKYELSSLPPDHIIEMNVNMKEFKDLTSLGHKEMLRIGITGHVNLDPEEITKLQPAVKKAINFIEQQYPLHYLTVFSPLAMGADRLVARELLKIEASRLIAILPYNRDRYENEFGTADDFRSDPVGTELRSELDYWLSNRALEIIEMSPSPTRRASYLKAGRFIAEHSNVIIVVWDGSQYASTSITAQIAARAEELKIPICHIWASNCRQKSSEFCMEGSAGEIHCKNFPGQIGDEWEKI
jgi:hypothetical protein